jgi:hypothetical protein
MVNAKMRRTRVGHAGALLLAGAVIALRLHAAHADKPQCIAVWCGYGVVSPQEPGAFPQAAFVTIRAEVASKSECDQAQLDSWALTRKAPTIGHVTTQPGAPDIPAVVLGAQVRSMLFASCKPVQKQTGASLAHALQRSFLGQLPTLAGALGPWKGFPLQHESVFNIPHDSDSSAVCLEALTKDPGPSTKARNIFETFCDGETSVHFATISTGVDTHRNDNGGGEPEIISIPDEDEDERQHQFSGYQQDQIADQRSDNSDWDLLSSIQRLSRLQVTAADLISALAATGRLGQKPNLEKAWLLAQQLAAEAADNERSVRLEVRNGYVPDDLNVMLQQSPDLAKFAQECKAHLRVSSFDPAKGLEAALKFANLVGPVMHILIKRVHSAHQEHSQRLRESARQRQSFEVLRVNQGLQSGHHDHSQERPPTQFLTQQQQRQQQREHDEYHPGDMHPQGTRDEAGISLIPRQLRANEDSIPSLFSELPEINSFGTQREDKHPRDVFPEEEKEDPPSSGRKRGTSRDLSQAHSPSQNKFDFDFNGMLGEDPDDSWGNGGGNFGGGSQQFRESSGHTSHRLLSHNALSRRQASFRGKTRSKEHRD